MGARILSLLAVLVLVAACSSTPEEEAMVTTDTSGSRVTSTTPTDTSIQTNGVTPGTQQDLVVNIGDRVFFAYDQYDLTSEARSTVERQAQWLKSYPNVSIIVEGHADERGTREYNLALGEKRATSVRNYLIANGVEPNRLQTISYGKERPAILGSDEQSFAQNRRSVLVVQ